MKHKVLIVFDKITSPMMLGLELYDSLLRYKELAIYWRHIKMVTNISQYDAVIPLDTVSQQWYNSLEVSPFKSYYPNIYDMLDNKAICYKMVKNIQYISQIPTFICNKQDNMHNFISKNPHDKYIIKHTTGYASLYQSIVTPKQLLKMSKSYLKDCIVQPKLDNFKLYSLDVICKNGVIINDLFTVVGDQGIKFTDYIFHSINTEVINNKVLYSPIRLFCEEVIKNTRYSGLIEFEFIIQDETIYFLEINPRICGHIGQKDINKNSAYFNNIIIPYFKEFNIILPNQLIINNHYSGTSIKNLIPLIFSLNPPLFIIFIVIYIYLAIKIITRLNKYIKSKY